ncbi:MAG: EAL domain-containing protein [Gammaproteobacteria bacterium]|nr:EAL domain-containing protein [Gammaproteobacteria bacterium]
MATVPDSSVHFDHYLTLLKGFCPDVRAMVVFDHEQSCIWQGDASPLDLDQVVPQLKSFRAGDSDDVRVTLGDNASLELINLRNTHGEIALTLGIEAVDKTVQAVAANQNIGLLNEFLLADYEQSLALATKEDELNHMTDELTRRYEELNLIYKAEDQALNIYHGRELLRQLVMNTSRFLNVDIIFLYIAGKNIAMHKYKNDNPLFESDKLFDYLRDSVYPLLETDPQSLVINHIEDARMHNFTQNTPYKHVVSPVVNAENQVIGLLAIASQNFSVDFSNSDRNLLDVMSKKASKIAQSHFDPLTGLENSNSFELIIKDLLKQSSGTDVNHAIANVDIDRMAVVNDISGRDVGDLLIKKVGQKLASMVRSRDVVARIGSDKFGVLLENCDLPTAQIVMKKISHAVSAIDFKWEGESHEISVSIGIAPITAETQSVTSLMNAAETARNVSKERGRNSIHVLDLEDSNLLERKDQIRWVGLIQAALREDQFMLYAQLIKPLKTKTAKPHYELLLRMRGNDGSVIPPGKFLPAAENFYLMSSIDYWVIGQAFSELAKHNRESGQGCEVSINLSGQSLSDPVGFAAYIGNKLEQHQLDPSDICFEITESSAIENIDDARFFIDQVGAYGCQFSLDDFGTGLSSFAYLKNLKVSYLKIDGSFVTDIVTDPVSESMVSAINQVGHAMQLQTIAEFVENDAIAQKLVDIGVDYGQGYGFGKPVPFDEILSSLPSSKSKSA